MSHGILQFCNHVLVKETVKEKSFVSNMRLLSIFLTKWTIFVFICIALMI